MQWGNISKGEEIKAVFIDSMGRYALSFMSPFVCIGFNGHANNEPIVNSLCIHMVTIE